MVQLKNLTTHKRFRSLIGFLIGGVCGLVILSLLLSVGFLAKYRNKIYPGVMIGPIAVGGLSQSEAWQRVTASVSGYQNRWPLTFKTDGQSVAVALSSDAVAYDVPSSVTQAYAIGRELSFKRLASLSQLAHGTVHSPLLATSDDHWLLVTSASLAAQVNLPSVPPRLDIKNNHVQVVYGQSGLELNELLWRRRIQQSLSQLFIPESSLEMERVEATVSATQADEAVRRATTLLSATLTLNLDSDELLHKTWKLSGSDLVGFVAFDGGYNHQKISNYVSGVATAVNRAPKDAKFQFDETSGKVKEFVAPEKGIVVDVEKTSQAIEAALAKLALQQTVDPVAMVISEQDPTVTLAEVNRLGLKERLGVGTSTYKGSIPGRVHNVELAATRLNGTLIKPGETFSFNAAVGEVSAATGYEQAYIIQDGKTQLGDGGGLCQDSTTMFRAAMNAGLPIVSRKGHAYRVGYYEQDSKPGFDATVFSPSTDLTFINDTPAYLLIQTSYDSPARRLTYVIYGTNDGRTSSISDYAIWDITPPPPDVYQDDPTLPTGTTKQVDWKAVGSKTKFTYRVVRGGQTIFEKTFVTNYQPWASVYLRGTKQ